MTFEEFIEEEKVRDPEFRRLWEEGEPEFQVIATLVGARSRLGWTQKEMARRMGTDQATISRAENTGHVTADFMARFAQAVGGDVTLSVKVPGRRRVTFHLAPTAPVGGHGDPPPPKGVVPKQRRMTFRLAAPPKPATGNSTLPPVSQLDEASAADAPAMH